jgi:choline-glycine betaine transporter
MLLVGDEGEALTGIQNITIIMAAPFVIVMVVMCVALMKDLRNDPLVRRTHRCTTAIEQAVEFGTQNYGDRFYLPVKPHLDRASASGSGDGAT